MTDTAISFGNTLVPMVVLALISAVLPYALTPRECRSQRRVMLSVGLAALAMLVISGLVFSLFDTREIPEGGAAVTILVVWLYVKSSFGAVAVWGPVLALAWLGLAQRVEQRRGEEMARRDG